MTDAVLVVNAGSSSIKFAVYAAGAAPQLQLRGHLDALGTRPHFSASDAAGEALAGAPFANAAADLTHEQAFDRLFAWLADHGHNDRIVAAGHRVVHGGDKYAAPLLITAEVERTLEALVPLARLHQPHNLAAIRTLEKLRPGLPQYACFDTAFHSAQTPLAREFALPRELTDSGIKRYGFHGLSYEYIAGELPAHLGAGADGRVVVAHLGAGASMCALRARASVATTMGFSVLDGLVMGTRAGALDPGVLLYLMRERGMSIEAVDELLYRKSGLLGVSGISAEMRVLLDSNAPQAREAVELFAYRAAREIGSLAAALGGLDALVFTGGIGEHAAAVREKICAQCAWLGLEIDPQANARAADCISKAGARVSAWVIPTDEELVIARHTCRLMATADT